MATAKKIAASKQFELIAKTSEVFSPAAPINRRDLFAGRIDQIQRVFDAVSTRGQHAVIFGERGVGKTSLANIVKDTCTSVYPEAGVAKLNCAKTEDFESIWRKALAKIELLVDTGEATVGLKSKPVERSETAASELPKKTITPDDILVAAERIGKSIIIFDEFDRLGGGQDRFADTIKTLSDSSCNCTLVLVGVANNINGLIAEHASIDRSLAQIQMPRMIPPELHEILNKAMGALGMEMAQEARSLIVSLSQGLPHYTHVLGKTSTLEALKQARATITIDDVRSSIDAALENTEQSIREAYQQATMTTRRDTLFKQVLLSCAMAEVDESGYFASADVRDPLSEIMQKKYEIPNYAQHLEKFCSAERGSVLEKTGKERRFRFRFSNPLLQPFVIMRGLSDKMISEDLMNLFRKRVLA